MMTRGKTGTILLVAVLLLAVACAKQPESAPAGPSNASAIDVEKLKKEAKDAVTTTTAYLIQQKEQLQKNLSERMAGFDQQLSDLKAKSGQTGEQAKSEWTNLLAQLQQKKQVAADKLDQLKNSSADKWQDFKAGAEAAFADLEKGLKDAFARSKDDGQSSR